MITLKSSSEIEIMKAGGKILGELLEYLAQKVRPSLSALELEKAAEARIKEAGAIPAFLNYDTGYIGRFPASLCISINDEVVHGVPAKNKIFNDGDIIGIDCGIWYQGLCTDAAITVPCGKISKEAELLIAAAKNALAIGISRCRAGNYIGDIGEGIERHVEQCGFRVIKSLVGHGVGRAVHEDPQIPNFFPFDERRPSNRGAKIKEGMTLAIEPMISISSEKTKRGRDGYAAATSDGSLAAHFEHTVAIGKRGPVILTSL